MSEQASGRGVAVDVGAPDGPMVVVEDLRRTYGSGDTAVHALRGVSFSVPRGELVALRGRSGSGKTTVLNLVGGLDTPTAAGSSWTARTWRGSATTSCWRCAATGSASSSSPSGSSRS